MEKAELKFKGYLATHKLKYTPERRTIFREIFDSPDHFEADQLFARLKENNQPVSRATVYRTLDLLVKLGFVRKLCLGDKSSLYENATNANRHGHLICLGCGKIEEFPTGRIEQLLTDSCSKRDFTAQNHNIQSAGYCVDCRNETLVRKSQDLRKEKKP